MDHQDQSFLTEKQILHQNCIKIFSIIWNWIGNLPHLIILSQMIIQRFNRTLLSMIRKAGIKITNNLEKNWKEEEKCFMKSKDRNINKLKKSKENWKSNVIGTCLIVINIHICGENDKMIKKIEK